MNIRCFFPRGSSGVRSVFARRAVRLLVAASPSKDADSAAHAPAVKPHPANGSGLQLEIKVSPDPVKLGEVREISVNIVVRNLSRQTATLKFSTTQILEIALRDVSTDTVVSKWSTDRSFADDRRIIPINKDEHLEFNEPLTTRELKVGRPYNVEVSFLGYEKELAAKR